MPRRERIVTIAPDVRATTAMALMGERGIRHLLVTRTDNDTATTSDLNSANILGVLTITDLTDRVAGDQARQSCFCRRERALMGAT